MSDTTQNDVLVYFLQQNQSVAVPAESQSALNPDDVNTVDFKPGHFFTTEGFALGISLADDTGSTGPASPVKTPAAPGTHANTTQAPTAAPAKTADTQSFARWRALPATSPAPKPPFEAYADPISLTRSIDSASPILLSQCLNFTPFDKVVIVKRARIGTSGLFGTIVKLEFRDVVIKQIDWEDNDAVKEVIKFVYKRVVGRFIKRSPSGAELSKNYVFTWDEEAEKKKKSS